MTEQVTSQLERPLANNQARYHQALKRGNAYNAREDWKRAFHSFRVALAEAPQAPEAYAGLGEACFGLKMVDRALESYKLAARYSRGDLQYLERVADLQERLGLLLEAARTYMAVAEIQLRHRQLDEAVYNWERAVRLEPALLGAHRRLAMVHQRQRNVRGAIREYLAIARILQGRGQQQQALQMCHAALRLDPGNEDVLMAMRLVTHGEGALREEEPLPAPEAPPALVRETTPPSEEDQQRVEMADTVRQIATVFEDERRQWQQAQQPQAPADPLSLATRRAQDELADEIFRDEEGEADFYGVGPNGLSKLERDALIGQGIDFQSRGDLPNAVTCYEKAVAGGLRLPAAYFTLGMLYLQQGKIRRARAAFLRAGKDVSYRPPIKLAMVRS